MNTLDDLLAFMKNSGTVGQVMGISDWKLVLGSALPSLKEILQDRGSWEIIEKAWPSRPSGSQTHDLAEALVRAGGAELAGRWLDSEDRDQSRAAEDWIQSHLSMWSAFDDNVKKMIVRDQCREFLDEVLTVAIWKGLGDDLKNDILSSVFKLYPGEALKTIERYLDYIEHLNHVLHDRFNGRHQITAPPFPRFVGYVPAPQIEKVRFIIEDAGDEKYLARIQQMIGQRREACQGISLPEINLSQRVAYSPNPVERELIARLLDKALRHGYLPAALPALYVSNETPPLFVAYPELEQDDPNSRDRNEHQVLRHEERSVPEEIAIEQLLGVYQPRQQQVIIYERGITWCAERKHLDEDRLFAVVLIHEISHWLTHQLLRPGIPAWPTELYILGETDLHEGLAQLMTWWIADELGGSFRETFEELNRHQSDPYVVFEDFKQVPVGKVMASLERLRMLPWPARLQDWMRALA
jgi:hypothetical protein